MKKGVLGIFLLLSTISFASAAGIGNLLDLVDESTLILSSIFIVTFAILFFSLQRVFKGNNGIAGIVSAVISLVTVYFINKSGFDFSGFFLDIGISEEVIWTIVPLLIVAGVIFAIIKLRTGSLILFGGLLILLSFFAYEKVLLIFLGIVLAVVGIFFVSKKKLPVDKKTNNSQTNTKIPPNKTNTLINEAKNFKNWALKTDKPNFYGGWAYFLSYLKKRGYGNSESDIIRNIGITRSDFIRIFNQYGKI